MSSDRPCAEGSGVRGGFALLELTIALVALAITLTGVSALVTSSLSLGESNDETGVSREGASSMLDTLRGTPFAEVFARFDATSGDDPAGGASPGAGFSVLGLDPVPGDPDGLVGEIQFPGDGVTLREDFQDRELGMPRDLNGDGVIDSLDHSTDYIVLPVRVRILWRTTHGTRTLDLVTTLAN